MEAVKMKISKEEQAQIINDVLLEHHNRPRMVENSRGVIVTTDAIFKGYDHPVTVEYIPGSQVSSIRVRLRGFTSSGVKIEHSSPDEYQIRQAALEAYLLASQPLRKRILDEERRNLFRSAIFAVHSVIVEKFSSTQSHAKGGHRSHVINGLMRRTGWKVTIHIIMTEDMLSFSVKLPRGKGFYKTDILRRFVSEDVVREYAEYAFTSLLEQNGWNSTI